MKFAMQEWMDAEHGKVIRGIYKGYLLRAGMYNGPYVDMLTPNGWSRLDSVISSDVDSENLFALKKSIDVWLSM